MDSVSAQERDEDRKIEVVAEALWSTGSQLRSLDWGDVDKVIKVYWRTQAKKALDALESLTRA